MEFLCSERFLYPPSKMTTGFDELQFLINLIPLHFQLMLWFLMF